MKYHHFSIEEREFLQEMWWQRRPIRSMARALKRSPSSVSRELKRNFPPEHKVYAPRLAQQRALTKRKCRGRYQRLKNDNVRQYVISHLKRRWSPEQIAGCIFGEIGEHISHEAIYRFIYAHIRYSKPQPGYEDLRPFLRRRRKLRIPKGSRRCQRVAKPLGISIDARPQIIEKRKRVGDWESDTVESKDHKPGINTLVERKTGFVFMTKLSAKTSIATARAIEQRLTPLPAQARHTITFDNGPENQAWRHIEAATNADCYFAHPYHSWERGTNENTNGLIRDYFPKKTDFTTISEAELSYVEQELNTRPRKRLGWQTPLEALSVALEG